MKTDAFVPSQGAVLARLPESVEITRVVERFVKVPEPVAISVLTHPLWPGRVQAMAVCVETMQIAGPDPSAWAEVARVDAQIAHDLQVTPGQITAVSLAWDLAAFSERETTFFPALNCNSPAAGINVIRTEDTFLELAIQHSEEIGVTVVFPEGGLEPVMGRADLWEVDLADAQVSCTGGAQLAVDREGYLHRGKMVIQTGTNLWVDLGVTKAVQVDLPLYTSEEDQASGEVTGLTYVDPAFAQAIGIK
ncbi:hypothetical protein A2160_04025 [Candidatus Beckwithbacteria bacterium RBG_13_42_9]|uniref:Uncharacterized protein n=1 Tax=Candidatus Beckwithbacteria bacterium RBG_13_42_9 TaxID=1797457 RepID=A0A1F5E3C9_9BACT|nr:MAG: hypothetical protein A2160_04025 [Candidatus Beckwithbacteria bacterium RBG_13_42_9]